MKAITRVIKVIGLVAKYAGIVLVIVEILEFAKSKLEAFNLNSVKDESDTSKA